MRTLNSKLIFVGLQVLDLLTTLGCFHFGLIESNPVTAHLIGAFGILAGLIVSKALACLAVMPMKKLVWAGNCAYLCVVIWNLFLLSVFGLAAALS